MLDDASGILICQATRRNMQYSFMWPNYDEELNPSKMFYVKLFLFLLTYSMIPLSILMHVIKVVRNDIDLRIGEEIGAMGSIFGIMYMALLYIQSRPKIAILLKEISDFSKYGKPKGFDELNKKSNVWSFLAFMYPTLGAFACDVIKLFEKPACKLEIQSKYPDETCGLIYPFWIPFDIDYFPVFHLIFLYVCVSHILFVRLHLAIFCQAVEIAQHIILKINQLCEMIEDAFAVEDYERSRKKLGDCIVYHQHILRLSTQLDDSFSDLMFLHFVMTAIIFACLEKQLVEGVSALTGAIHLVGWIMSLFIASHGGQALVDASEEITKSLWSSKWYTADMRLQKSIIFMMAKSQKELCINVGSFGVLSYMFFLSVLKMSYSVLAMLTS